MSFYDSCKDCHNNEWNTVKVPVRYYISQQDNPTLISFQITYFNYPYKYDVNKYLYINISKLFIRINFHCH
jgi:hypothetical protein